MAANEVIANLALEHMGKRKGEYEYCDPHDHVNLAQSTNDAYPSALHVAIAQGNVAHGRGHQLTGSHRTGEGRGSRPDPEMGAQSSTTPCP